ncbi:hypothetical protein AgCh_004087 [Apium graveolens]
MVREEGFEANDEKQKQICRETITVTERRSEVNNKKQRREERRGGPSSASCEVCMDVIPIRNSIHIPKCNHILCTDCMGSYLQKNIQEDVREVKCPNSKCKVVLEPEFCREFIPEKVYKRWIDALNEIYNLENARKIKCPSEDCEGVFTVDRRFVGRGTGIKKQCRNCGRPFCLRCKSELYIGFSCKICDRPRRINHQRNLGSKVIHI